MPDPQISPDHIREMRRASGLSQTRFGARLGVATRTVLEWESSEDSPTHRTPKTPSLRLLHLVDASGLARIALPTDDKSDEYGGRKLKRSMTPERAKQIRGSTGLSQALFGAVLGISRETVSRWECEKGQAPTAPAARLLALIELHGIDWIRVSRPGAGQDLPADPAPAGSAATGPRNPD